MAGSYAFDGKSIRRLRNDATSYWMQRVSFDGPEGWSKCTLNPMAVLAFFDTLWLKPGFVLRAYQYRNCASGKGAVWALPVGASFPEPASLSPNQTPRPTDALDDVMEIIEGDGSPWSYFCASLLARELGDFAGYGAGVSWMTQLVLDGDPWINPNGSAHALAGQGFSSTNDGWSWKEFKPLDWSPTVYMKDDAVTVRFFSFSGFGRQRIILSEDSYRPGNYIFRRSEQVLASGPEGIRW